MLSDKERDYHLQCTATLVSELSLTLKAILAASPKPIASRAMVAGGPLFTSQTKEYSKDEMLFKPAAFLSLTAAAAVNTSFRFALQ
jgi:hypothetical protein